MNRDRTTRQWIVFSALVAFGVLGRWLQPDWNFTPVAAIAGFAAYYFGSVGVAMLAAFSVLAISNLWLPAYDGAAMAAAVYASYIVPAALGRWLHGRFGWGRFAALGVAPSVSFFATTNLAHWAFLKQYPHTWDGLLACYAAAIPFFRGTLAGDVFYTFALFAAYAVAVRWAELRRTSRVDCSASA